MKKTEIRVETVDTFFERGRKRLFSPGLLGVGGMAFIENVGGWIFGDLRLEWLLWRHDVPRVLS